MAEKVYDKPLLDKLGVQPGSDVVVLGVRDADFDRELAARGAKVATRMRAKAPMVFLGIGRPADLARIAAVEPKLARNGALWLVRPRGDPALKDEILIAAAKAAGMVDNKICRFSATHTAMRLVVPLARR